MNRQKIKSFVYFAGKSLGLLGLIYVFYTLSQEYTFSSFAEQFILLLKILPFLLILNFLSVIIGIYAWHVMLLHYAQKTFPYLASYYYFSKTEIAKYLPGNVFHFVGRQVLSSKLGISQVEMAKISLLFSILLLTGTVITSTFFAFASQAIPYSILTLMGLSCIIILIILVYLYPTFPTGKKLSMNIYLALSVAIQGIMLGVIILYQSDSFTVDLFLLCIGIYTLSWLLGFVTPGASGGLGIREGTFIAITSYLQVDISGDIIIFSVLLVRLVNICVDIGIFLSTFIFENKIKGLKI